MGICVVRLTTNFKIKYDTHLAYNIYTMLCPVNFTKMKKIQCPNIEIGENVHKHYCQCCEGKQHIPFAKALKYQLRGLLVLTDDGKADASDCEMHRRIESYIDWYKSKHEYNVRVDFERKQYGEPISTLNACIDTLRFYGA